MDTVPEARLSQLGGRNRDPSWVEPSKSSSDVLDRCSNSLYKVCLYTTKMRRTKRKTRRKKRRTILKTSYLRNKARLQGILQLQRTSSLNKLRQQKRHRHFRYLLSILPTQRSQTSPQPGKVIFRASRVFQGTAVILPLLLLTVHRLKRIR